MFNSASARPSEPAVKIIINDVGVCDRTSSTQAGDIVFVIGEWLPPADQGAVSAAWRSITVNARLLGLVYWGCGKTWMRFMICNHTDTYSSSGEVDLKMSKDFYHWCQNKWIMKICFDKYSVTPLTAGFRVFKWDRVGVFLLAKARPTIRVCALLWQRLVCRTLWIDSEAVANGIHEETCRETHVLHPPFTHWKYQLSLSHRT